MYLPSFQILLCIYNLLSILQEKVSEEDRKKVIDKCDEMIKWLDQNQSAEKHEFEDRVSFAYIWMFSVGCFRREFNRFWLLYSDAETK